MRNHRPPANRWVPSCSLPSSYIQAREPVDILHNLKLRLRTNACKHICMNAWKPGRTGRHCSNTSQSLRMDMLQDCLDTICTLKNNTLSDLANKPDTKKQSNEPRFHAKSSATRVVRCWRACGTSSVHRHMAPSPAARAAASRHPNTLISASSQKKRRKKQKGVRNG